MSGISTSVNADSYTCVNAKFVRASCTGEPPMHSRPVWGEGRCSQAGRPTGCRGWGTARAQVRGRAGCRRGVAGLISCAMPARAALGTCTEAAPKFLSKLSSMHALDVHRAQRAGVASVRYDSPIMV